MFLTPNDFTGKYEISTGMYDTPKLQSYIDRYEATYLRHLFGVSMYNDLLSDLDVNNVPQSPNYEKLFLPFAEDVTLYAQLESLGVLDMLKGFIYFEYYKDLVNLATPYGGVKPSAENSTIVGTTSSTMYTRYNEAVKTYRAIRDYIYLNNPSPTGQLVSLSVEAGGTGYVTASNVPLISLVPTATGGIVDIVANLIGGIGSTSLLTAGTGYTAGIYLVTGGTGSGAVVEISDDGLGGVSSVTIIDAGIGYTDLDVITIDGGNLDATIEVSSTYLGEITSVTIVDAGTGYEVDQLLDVDGGNLDAQVRATYVGKGSYSNYNGVDKLFTYWI